MATNPGATLVEAPEATEAAGRWRVPLSAIAVLVIVVAFLATRPEVQHAGRIGLGIAGLVPLATTLRGSVTDESGAPVTHAEIGIDQASRIAFSVSDQLGSYALAFDVMANAPVAVSIGATGYETRTREIRIRSSEATYDARLHRLIRIDAGAEIRLSVASDDDLCYSAQQVWPCRTVHVTALSAGALRVEALADDPHVNLAVRLSVAPGTLVGTPALASGCCAARAELTVPQGTEVTAEVLFLDLANVTTPASSFSQGFTLRTSE